MAKIGKLMQHLGLLLPPLAILWQLLGGSLGNMLLMLGFAFAMFWLGRIVEGYASPR